MSALGWNGIIKHNLDEHEFGVTLIMVQIQCLVLPFPRDTETDYRLWFLAQI